jgi:hypothetical protein
VVGKQDRILIHLIQFDRLAYAGFQEVIECVLCPWNPGEFDQPFYSAQIHGRGE